MRYRKGTGSRAVLAIAVAAGLASSNPALAQEAFTLNADGNAGNSPNPAVYTWHTAPWVGLAGEYPGSGGRTADTATLNFREFNNADQAGDAHIDIDLGGLNINLASLTFTESGTGNSDGDFQNGTFTLSNINYLTGGREIDFETTLTINGAGTGALTVNNTGGSSIDFIGAVNTTSFTYVGSTSFIRINQQTTSSFYTLTLNQTGGAFVLANYDTAVSSNVSIDDLIVNGVGKFELQRAAGTLAFGATISNSAEINSARFRLDSNDDDAVVTFLGPVTVANSGAGVEIGTEDQRGFINLNGGLEGNEVITFNLHGPLGVAGDHGSVTVANVASTRTAANIIQGGRVNLDVDNGLGTGKITVRDHGFLNLVSAQSALNVDVAPFGAIGGVFVGGTLGGNVTIAPQNVVFVQDVTPSVVPTRAQTAGAVHWLGVTSNSALATVGDDGDPGTLGDIYQGIAIGQYTGGGLGNFTGTITPAVAGQDMFVLMQVGKVFGSSGTATFNTTGSVTFTGPGIVLLDEPSPAGITRALATAAPDGADVFFRVGDATTQNHTFLRFVDANSLLAGQTFNAIDGRVDLDADNAVAPGAIVNIGSGATLSLDRNFTTGTFRIGDGGAIAVNNINHINSGATFEVTGTNAMLILDGDFAIAAGTPLDSVMRVSDLILNDADADAFTDVGLVLGNGKRLSTPSSLSVDLTGGIGVSAVPGATSVTFTASAPDTLDINDPVNLAGVHLNIGDTNPVNTIFGGATTNFTRVLDAPNGTVALNLTTARSIDVRSGLLRFEQGAIPGLKDGSITTAVAGVGGGTTIRDGAAIEIEYNQETDPAGIVINETFFLPANYHSANSSGRAFILDRLNTVTGGNNIITLNNVVVGNNVSIGVDVQDTTSTEGRLSLRLVGSATVTDQSLTGADQDDFSLHDVTSANADGSPSAGPRTLNLGVAPAGVTPGSTAAPNTTNFTWNGSVYGTIGAGVTINSINAQTDFQNGSVLNGTFNVQVREGDFFVRIRAGADGNVANRLTGTGQFNHGHLTGTVIEDIAGFVDEVDVGAVPNPSLTPIHNATDVQVNILNLTGSGGGNRAILRAERGVNAADATDISGTFEFSNVRLENGAIAALESTNSQIIKAGFVLDRGSGAVTGNNASQVFIGNVTDPGAPDTLTVTGTNNVRIVGTVTAQRLIVGGPGLGANVGNVVLQPSALSTQVVNSVAFPLLAGPASSGVLDLAEFLDIGQGGNVDVGFSNIAGGNLGYSVSTGVRLSGNGSLDLFAPLSVPAGKRLTGSSSTTLKVITSGTNTGALTILAGGILAPGETTGILTIEGTLQMADNSIYEYQIGSTPALSDRVTITGTGSTVTFGDNLQLNITNPGLADVTGQTYILYSYTGDDPATLPNIIFTGPLTGDVTMNTTTNQILLSHVVPEPATAGLLALTGIGLLARRRRAR